MKTHGKEIKEQMEGELIELLGELNIKKGFKYYLANFLTSIIGWGILLVAILGIYQLLRWLILM